MLSTRQTVKDWIVAHQAEDSANQRLDEVFRILNSDNYIVGVSSNVLEAYTGLVKKIVGKERWEWVEWWVYETCYGKYSRDFCILGEDVYDAQKLSFDEFWTIVTRQHNPLD